jgi:hypothetical protein
LKEINILNLLSKPFDLNQINLILNELSLQQINNIKNKKLKDIEIITYCLYFLDSSQIEKIHWSYFSLEYFFIFFDKINNIQKIIEIINWNYIYNSNYLKLFELILYRFKQNNNVKNIIVYDYLCNLDLPIYDEKKYNLVDLPKKYNEIINLIEKKSVYSKKINYNEVEIIKNLIINVKCDKVFDKIINLIDKNKLIDWISKNLNEQNIHENKIIKILQLFDDKNKKNHNLSNIKLFCKLLSNGYAYCIKKIWSNNLPKINVHIEKTILEIIKKDNDKIFKALLEENILNNYLYCKKNLYLWSNILFKSHKISIILINYKYNIPKNVILQIISIIKNIKYKYKYKYFNNKNSLSDGKSTSRYKNV